MINLINQCQLDNTLNKLHNMIIHDTNGDACNEETPVKSEAHVQQEDDPQQSLEETTIASTTCLYPDNAGVNTEEFIQKTLVEHAKDRVFMLGIEKILTDFVNDDKLKSYKFHAMNPYQRMLVHRIGAYFCLGHNVDHETKQCVIVSKTDKSRVPNVKFQSFIPLNETPINQQQPIPPPPPPQIQNELPKTLVTHSPPQIQTQQKQILRREKPLDETSIQNSTNKQNDSSSANSTLSTATIRTKTFEEKSAEYLKIKQRIFNDSNVKSDEKPFISHSLSASQLIKSNNNNSNNHKNKLSSSTTVNTSFQQQQQFTILNRNQPLINPKQNDIKLVKPQNGHSQYMTPLPLPAPSSAQLSQTQHFNYMHQAPPPPPPPQNGVYFQQLNPYLMQFPSGIIPLNQSQYLTYESQNGHQNQQQTQSHYIYQQQQQQQPQQQKQIQQQYQQQIPLNQYFQSQNGQKSLDTRRLHYSHQKPETHYKQQHKLNATSQANNNNNNSNKHQHTKQTTKELLLQVYDFKKGLQVQSLINQIKQVDNQVKLNFFRANDMHELNDLNSLVDQDLSNTNSNLIVLLKMLSVEHLNRVLSILKQINDFKIKTYN